MTISNARYSIAPQVVREVFDDEVIIIDMKSGNYFSLNQPGVRIWTLLEQGCAVVGIVDRLREDHPADSRETIVEGVIALVNRLVEEGLIEGSNGVSPASCAESQAGAASAGPFVKPELSVFTDMQELLLLDPIHDVDETGWPSQRPEGDGG